MGLTQVALSKATGIAQGLISSYEKGRIAPGGTKLVAIARALGTTAEWLIVGDDPSLEAA